MRGLARVVRGLLDRLDVPAADVLGYSFGGAVAQQLAHDAPDRVRRLILASTTPGVVGVPGSLRALPHMVTPLRYYSPAYLRRITPLIAGGRTMRDAERLDEHASARATAPPSFWGYQSQLMAMTGWTSAMWLHQLHQPTLVLTGDEDPLVPLANARLLARAIPHARLHVIPGGGHLVLLDQPRDAAAAVSRFLATA
jgi:pimeloyl-ACP methyl ester carboxylesterase